MKGRTVLHSDVPTGGDCFMKKPSETEDEDLEKRKSDIALYLYSGSGSMTRTTTPSRLPGLNIEAFLFFRRLFKKKAKKDTDIE
jgi:hypothetical protein